MSDNSSRMSVRGGGRQRRTTMLSGKDIEDALNDPFANLEEQLQKHEEDIKDMRSSNIPIDQNTLGDALMMNDDDDVLNSVMGLTTKVQEEETKVIDTGINDIVSTNTNITNNRMSMRQPLTAARKRRTTVFSAKEIDEALKSEEIKIQEVIIEEEVEVKNQESGGLSLVDMIINDQVRQQPEEDIKVEQPRMSVRASMAAAMPRKRRTAVSGKDVQEVLKEQQQTEEIKVIPEIEDEDLFKNLASNEPLNLPNTSADINLPQQSEVMEEVASNIQITENIALQPSLEPIEESTIIMQGPQSSSSSDDEQPTKVIQDDEDDDRAIKLRVTKKVILEEEEDNDDVPHINDDPFQDSEEDEGGVADIIEQQPFTSMTSRTGAYIKRDEDFPIRSSEVNKTKNSKCQSIIEQLQQKEYSVDTLLATSLISAGGVGAAGSSSIAAGLAGVTAVASAVVISDSEQVPANRSKVNNRVAKVFKEDDDMFDIIEKNIMNEEFEKRLTLTAHPVEQRGVVGSEQDFQNFDDLLRESKTQQKEDIQQPITEDIDSRKSLVDLYRRRGSAAGRLDGNAAASLSERRYNKTAARQSTNIEDEPPKKVGFADDIIASARLSGQSNENGGRHGSQSSNRSKTDFNSIYAAKSTNNHNRRLTLRDVQMSMPEENSSLESEEDQENYLEWLQNESVRLQKSQLLIDDPEAFHREIYGIDYKPKDEGSMVLDPDDPRFFQRASVKQDDKKTKKPQYSNSRQRDLIDVIEELENEDDFEGDDFELNIQEVDDVEVDDFYTEEFYSSMYQDVMKIKEQEKTNTDKKKSSPTFEYKDLMKTIDWNERRYLDEAKTFLKKNALLSGPNGNKTQVRTRIVSNFTSLAAVTNKLVKERQLTTSRSTCLGLSDELLMIGNSEGAVWMFDRENEQYYATFSEKSKEFLGNAVTAIDVHPLRPEYVVLGFEKGQIVLIDVLQSPSKSMKVIKEHHKSPIVNIKFVDWAGPQGKLYGLVKKTTNPRESVRPSEDDDKPSQSWMTVSIDSEGQVMITSIVKIVIVFKLTKHLAIDPLTSYYHTFQSMSARFRSPVHGSGIYDHIPMIAIGCRDSVLILEARQTGHRELFQINKPEKFYNKENQTFDPFRSLNSPALSWGYGMSPLLKDRPHSILAIAWGPVIQLAVLIDNEEADQPFVLDGFYIVHTFDMEVVSLSNLSGLRMSTDIPIQESNSLEQVNLDSEISNVIDFQTFTMPQTCYIEGVFFLSDSTLMILLSGQEIRILDTQSFHPEHYDVDSIMKRSKQSMKRMMSQTSNAGISYFPEELERGIRCAQVLKAEQLGFSFDFPLYSSTIKFFQGKLVMMTSKGIQSCQHLTWQQSIFDFQKAHATKQLEDGEDEEDLTQVFLRALEIYKGRVKGYVGLIDNAYLRENFLRAELKLLVKEIIQQVIEEVTQIKPQRLTTVDLKAADQEKQNKFVKIVRIAIEFCVELRDCDFLFKDLCWLFQDFGGKPLELAFVQELEPYIFAGKFQEWELPPEVFESYIERYYINSDTCVSTPETFDKIIVNLNLNQCPKGTVLNFIKYCEQHFLTTGVIFLYTQLFERKDNASCVQVLFSLYDLYKRATEEQKTSATKCDLETLQDIVSKADSEEKQRLVEKSQIYLGYKLFWMIRLYLNGKKFPQGNIKEGKWRAYVHDIVQFLSSYEILRDLLIIDAETVFQVLSVLFIKSSKPYELVLLGRDDFMSAGPSNYNMRFQTHIDFLSDMDECILGTYAKPTSVPIEAQQQYLFFVANVVAKDRDFRLHPKYFCSILKELLKHHEKYQQFNKQLQEIAQTRNVTIPKVLDPVQIMMQIGLYQESNTKFRQSRESSALMLAQQQEAQRLASEELKYVAKTENDLLNLLRKSEPLETKQIQDLLQVAETTPYEQVQLYLFERNEEYVKCLQMLMREADKKRSMTLIMDPNGGHLSHFANHFSRHNLDSQKLPIATQLLLMSEIGAQAERKGDRTIRWLGEKIGYLQAKVETEPDSLDTLNMYKALKHEAMINIRKLLSMSRVETIHLIEERFDASHKEVLNSDQLRREPLEQLSYLETLLEEQEETISETIRRYGFGQQEDAVQAKMYIEFIKLRLKLCCQFKPQGVFSLIERMLKGRKNGGGDFYPLEDCLQICQEHNQIEATFLLNKKLGKYFEAVNIGLKIMRTKVDLTKIKIELYFAKKNNINTDYYLSDPQMNECQFFDSFFKRIYTILNKHGKEIEADKEEKVWYLAIDAMLDLKQNQQVGMKAYCLRFFQQRLNILVEAMSRIIPFGRFLEHALSRYQDTQFKEFQEIILQIVLNQTCEENILTNANSAISKVNSILFESFQQSTKFGVISRSRTCNICKKYLDKKWYDENDEFHHDNHMMVDDDEEDIDEDPMTQEQLKVFACTHTFHIPCLKRSYRKKMTQQEFDQVFQSNLKNTNQLKCPTCNIASLEIESGKQGRGAIGQASKAGAIRQGRQIEKMDDVEEYRQKNLSRMTKRENQKQNVEQRKIEKLQKLMTYFDGMNDDAGLKLDDFAIVKVRKQQQKAVQKQTEIITASPATQPELSSSRQSVDLPVKVTKGGLFSRKK